MFLKNYRWQYNVTFRSLNNYFADFSMEKETINFYYFISYLT